MHFGQVNIDTKLQVTKSWVVTREQQWCNITFSLLNISLATSLFGQDYFDKFNLQGFLQMSYSANSLCAFRLFRLKHLHEFTSSMHLAGADGGVDWVASHSPWVCSVHHLSTL